MTLGRAKNIVTLNDFKELAGVPSYEIVNHHIHKLIQVLFVYLRVSFFWIHLPLP